MHWDVFFHLSTLQVQFHWLFAIVAFLLGSAILLVRKGTSFHVLLGRAWVAIMVFVSLSALFIRGFPGEEGMPRVWGFSPIHLLIPFTLMMLYLGIASIRRGDRRRHRYYMVSTFVGSLLLAGAFTFLPGRHMHTFFFGETEQVQAYVDEGYKK